MTATVDRQAVPDIAPTFRFQWEEPQDCYVLLYPEGMVKLSPSAGEILKRCDGKTPVDSIIEDLNRAFPGADLDKDVLTFIEKAVENGWLKI